MNTRSMFSLVLGLAIAPAAVAQSIPTLQQSINQMTQAAANFPAICQMVDLTAKYGTPKTWQGRSMYAVKISDNVAAEEDEEAILVVSAHHGNEFGTTVVALDHIARLTEGYGSDPEIKRLVDNHEIWIAANWNPDGYPNSRHNRNPNGTVDLNRNYPFLWASRCNTGTKGVGPGSEPETKTMMALSEDQRFTKVLDFHSSGRETLYAYRQSSSCPNHYLTNYLRAEAVALSSASSYGGQVRGPSSNGEHYHWQLGNFSNWAFLTEISNTQSPSGSSAANEAARVWPGTVFMMDRPVPVWGHITDATSGAPIEANISYVENPFTQGERNRSEPGFGRYHAFLPNGNHTLRVSAPCYVTQDVSVSVTSAGRQVEIQMVRGPGFVASSATVRNGTGVNPLCLSSAGGPIAGAPWYLTVDPSGTPGGNYVWLVGTTQGTTGPLTPAGELLLNLQSAVLFFGVRGTSGAPTTIDLPVPASGVLGLTGSIQGLVSIGDRGVTLCNAIDFTVGCGI